MEDRGDYLDIRKLRKKLRQIENLERLSRPLNEEEALKISKKSDFRERLQHVLSQFPPRLKSQDVMPTAILIAGVEPEVHSPVSIEVALAQDSEVPIKTEHDDALKRPIEARENDSIEGDTLSRHSSRPSSPKRIKKEECAASREKLQQKEPITSGAQNATNLELIWRSSEFTVHNLEGHNDIISAVAADGNLVVTASRDTTVKVWNSDSHKEVFSLRGHTGSVTCLILLCKEHSDELCRYLGLASSHRLALTGANDSTIILWSVTTGELKKSIYTFNTVTCAAYIQPEVCFITATDGGKLQIWDAVSGTMLRSLTAYDDSYTCMKAFGSNLYTAASDGIIKIWEVRDRDLTKKFSMDDLVLPGGTEIILRTVQGLEVYEDWVYFGDEGPNVKAFNWKNGEVKKFVNHLCEWGSTDGIACTGQELITSSYNLDEAKGYLNVRLYPQGQYLCSMDDGQTGRICCMAHTSNGGGSLRIITGGTELKVWDILQAPQSGRKSNYKGELLLKTLYIPYYNKEAEQSEYESSEGDTEEDSDSSSGRYERTYIPIEIKNSSSIWSYCSIL